ncbi:uncharacterized protein LOC129764516 [Toxorhynchites rutilus septentrionalis]|uniref:uncharacterized protein LOC129764516 n=1 Tax=Toxorhynchites rutilus septentrionalis TaxID=329112 RepID=UPI00247B0509|nr:uncharacterized protein LOC129764516 [Toxorhynchites rutilus septentrionalis]XP_055619670.1 uncharacterized protein LOC129764516 [Toxorhynchites rutilus septentrionalis]
MLTATFELEQEDVNPDDYLESKQHPQIELRQSPPARNILAKTSDRQQYNNQQQQQQKQISDSPKVPVPLSPLSTTNGGRAFQLHQHKKVSLIKLKRRYRDKENNEDIGNNSSSPEYSPEEKTTRKQLFLEVVEEDYHRREQESSKSRKRKNCLSLSKVVQSEAKRKRDAKKNACLVEEQIQCSPPVFEEEERDEKSADCSGSLSGKSQRSSQPIDWDQLEVFSEEEHKQTEKREPSPFDFDSLFNDRKEQCAPRTYPGCSSTRLSLSKRFQQQQHLLHEEQRSNCVTAKVTIQHSEKKQQQCRQEEINSSARLPVVGGEDDMSIRHQQHYHLPCTSVSSATNGYHSEVGSTSPILLLAAAAGEPDKMSGHSHYTRSKISSLQGRFSQATATDMAITASLNDKPRNNKANSLQGRVDTGTATELAIAQSLSEEQQNMLNSSSPVASPVIINLCTPATPASIAAAANLNNSLATLCNIGNSCYLNSVLYTLRFAPNFIHNLHHLIEDTDSVYQRLSQYKLKSSSLGRNIPGLHGPSGRSWSSKDLASLGGGSAATTNSSSSSTLTGPIPAANGISGPPLMWEENPPPKSNRQVVTEQLHELFQNLHKNETLESTEPFHAGSILRAVQDVSATFEGNQQQDAHEFLMCVLDSIRESCQALIKTITAHPDVLINACPPVPECIETNVSESKGARNFFRRKKESMKTSKPTNGGGATLPKASAGGGGGGGDGVSSDQIANLKNALFAKPSSVLDEQHVRERVQALGLDFFRDNFEGITVAKTKCLACETCTEQKETMIDIAIPIAASEISEASKNPQFFYQNSCITREYFRGDNKYRCEVCCGYREAIRSISFEVLPRQLILQLKRFNGDMEKINSYIPTPFVLRCFCNTCLPKPDCDKPHIYRLYSVITHVGARMSVGHYIAYTSSLDVHAEYRGCGKDRRKQLLLSGGSIDGGGGGFGGANSTGVSSKSGNEKSTSVQLKKLFSSKKASSAGDMSKKIKNHNKLNLINGMEGLNLMNGSGPGSAPGGGSTTHFGSQSGNNSPNSNGVLTSNAVGSLANRLPCAGLQCCGIHSKNSHISLYGSNSSCMSGEDSGFATSNGVFLDGGSSGETYVNCNNSSPCAVGMMNGNSGLPATTTTVAAFEKSLSQQLWHMCDDDKIKIMSQAEFEEVLSPNRRHVITPYLLFYARYDIVPQSGVGRQQQKENSASDGTGVGLKKGDNSGDYPLID